MAPDAGLAIGTDGHGVSPDQPPETLIGGQFRIVLPAGVYGTLGSPAAGNIPRGREYAVSRTGNDGNFWLFGGTGFDVNGNYAYLNDLWKYQPMASLGGRPRPSDRRGNRSSGSRTAHSSFVTSPRPRIGTLGECQSYPLLCHYFVQDMREISTSLFMRLVLDRKHDAYNSALVQIWYKFKNRILSTD
jgi:hypothetical protein